MSINNSEDVNKYYHLINSLVDDYIDKWKVRPSNLSAYLKPGGQRFNKFLERNKLKGVSGAERVLRDVIEDRNHMEKDCVITFENFTLFESAQWKISNLRECIYKGMEKADLKMEKILADYFDINLGAVDILDSEKHKFRIEDWKNDDWRVVIYSQEDVDVIQTNLVEYLFEEISKKEIELSEGLSVTLDNLIDKEKFDEKFGKLITEDKLNKIICQCLGEDWSFEAKTKSHFIYIC